MLRNFGISLLLFGLLIAGIDGFRVRERVERNAPATNGSDVHFSEAVMIPPAH